MRRKCPADEPKFDRVVRLIYVLTSIPCSIPYAWWWKTGSDLILLEAP
jgi:hypothetical protein